MEDGGGWMVILRRKSDVIEQVNFNRLWSDYERGFGDLETEFWYGLHNMHCLTTRQEVDLRIVLKKGDGTSQEWKYGHFIVGGPETNYTLYVGQATSPNGTYNALLGHTRKKFTTYDRKNDFNPNANCAAIYRAGWWYHYCQNAVLTGGHETQGILWRNGYPEPDYTYYPNVEMMVRPKGCVPKD